MSASPSIARVVMAVLAVGLAIAATVTSYVAGAQLGERSVDVPSPAEERERVAREAEERIAARLRVEEELRPRLEACERDLAAEQGER